MNFEPSIRGACAISNYVAEAFGEPLIEKQNLHTQVEQLYHQYTMGLSLPQKIVLIMQCSQALALLYHQAVDSQKMGGLVDPSTPLERLGACVQAIPLCDSFMSYFISKGSEPNVESHSALDWSEYLSSWAHSWQFSNQDLNAPKHTASPTEKAHYLSLQMVTHGVCSLKEMLSINLKTLTKNIVDDLLTVYPDSYALRQELYTVHLVHTENPALHALCGAFASHFDLGDIKVPLTLIQDGKWDLAIDCFEQLPEPMREHFLDSQRALFGATANVAYTDAIEQMQKRAQRGTASAIEALRNTQIGIEKIWQYISNVSSAHRVNFKKYKHECLYASEHIDPKQDLIGQINGKFPLCSQESAARVLAYLIDPKECLEHCDMHITAGNPVVQKLAFATFVHQKIQHYMQTGNIHSTKATESLMVSDALLQALHLKIQVDERHATKNQAFHAPEDPVLLLGKPKNRL